MKKVVTIVLLIIFIISGVILYKEKFKIEFEQLIDTIEINKDYGIGEFVKVKNGTVINENDMISISKLGQETLNIEIKNKFNMVTNKTININVVDTEKPSIEYDKTIMTTIGKEIDLLKNVKVTDNSLEEIIPAIEGDYDLKKSGTYQLKYIAIDSSGNKEEGLFDLIVKKNTTNKEKNKYYIKVNKQLNVLMVYGLDENNEYSELVNTFVISAGENTPLGEFKTDLKYETLSLEGGVYGHYTVRFLKSRGIWFHSVPYFSKPNDGNWDDLEYEEYNKLGTLASLGCIRLAVIDAKWIYDNIPKGTTVEIYESDTLPDGVVKPTPIKIDVNSPNRGWDPTDPDEDNPWHN